MIQNLFTASKVAIIGSCLPNTIQACPSVIYHADISFNFENQIEGECLVFVIAIEQSPGPVAGEIQIFLCRYWLEGSVNTGLVYPVGFGCVEVKID